MLKPHAERDRWYGRKDASGAPTFATPSRPKGGLLTADELAVLLGVPRTWVYEQSRAGRIPTVTLGRYRRYRREAIEAWLQELETGVGDGRPRRLAR
jgi:excisionase family DNA binding protein